MSVMLKLSGAEAKTRDACRFAPFPAERPASVSASYHAIHLISRAIDKGMAFETAAILEIAISLADFRKQSLPDTGAFSHFLKINLSRTRSASQSEFRFYWRNVR